MLLRRLILRHVVSRPGRALLTLSSVVIGVAAVVAVTIAAKTTDQAYREMFAAVAGRAALEVAPQDGGSFDESLADAIATVPGVQTVAPILQRPRIVYLSGRRMQLLILGIDPAKDTAVRDYVLQQGTLFGEDHRSGVVLEVGLAESTGLRVGDEVKILTNRGVRPFPVTGLLQFRGSTVLQSGGVVFMPLKRAQALFAARGKLDAVQIVVDPQTPLATVMAAIQAKLPKDQGLSVHQPMGNSQSAEEILRASHRALQIVTALSLVMAGFIILNTFLMNVGERRRELAIMRALGATRQQITRLLFGEGLLLGCLGTVLGMAVGLVGAQVLVSVLGQILRVTLPAMIITPWPFVLATLFGFGVSLVGVAVPAYRAGNVSPLEGMSRVTREDVEGSFHRTTLAGLLIAGIAGGTLAGSILGRLPMDAAIVAAGGLMIGFVLLLPPIAEVLAHLVAGILKPFLRGEAKLARQQILRHRVRSTLTAGVLFVAAATGVGIANTILDNMRDVSQWYRRALAADFFIRAMLPDMADWQAAEIPDAVGEELRRIPGIESIDTARFVRVRIGELEPVAIVREFPATAPLPLDLVAGDPKRLRRQLHDGEVVLGTVLAQRLKLGVGDKLRLETRDGPRELPIAGLTNEYMVGGLVIYLERATAEQLLQIRGVDAYAVKVEPKALASVQARLETLCEQNGVLLHSFADLSSMIDGMSRGINGCLWGIITLGYLVAAIGVTNTLTMNVLEQTAELGILRIVAMTRWQVRKTIFTQAAIIGGTALVPGIPAGVGIAYLINLATMPAIGHPVEFVLRPLLLAVSFVAGLAIVVAAAWFPAERAARLKIGEALQYE
jgi:putative ABC transport system permease protein